MEYELYELFERLMERYLDLSDKCVSVIDDDIKDVLQLERTPEEKEKSWNRPCERIRKIYRACC